MGRCKTCKAPHRMTPARSGLETLYGDVMHQLKQLQLQNLGKTIKQYLKSTEVKSWMHINRSKSVRVTPPAPRKDPRADEKRVRVQLNQQNNLPNLSRKRRSTLQSHALNSECQVFPKCWDQKVVEIGNRWERNILDQLKHQERATEFGQVTRKPSCITANSASSNRKLSLLLKEPGNSRRSASSPRLSQSSSKSRKSMKTAETTKANRSSRDRTTVGKPQSLRPLSPTTTERSSTVSRTPNLEYNDEGTSPLTCILETRPGSMTSRRQFNSILVERVKCQRASDAELNLRERECLNAQIANAPKAILILRSSKQSPVSHRNMKENRTGALTDEDRTISMSQATEVTANLLSEDLSTDLTSGNFTSCSEAPISDSFLGKRFGLQNDIECNGVTRLCDQIGLRRPNSRSILDSMHTQTCRPLATAGRSTAILQGALEALECANRWNEWGARTLHQLAIVSKAAIERKHSLLGLSCINERKDRIHLSEKPEILLPYDNDVMKSARQGRVLESREEERVFVRDLLVASELTRGDWVDKHLLNAKQHVVNRTQTTLYRQHRQEVCRVPAAVGGISLKERFTLERKKEKKLLDQHILYDFVDELLRQELVLQKYAQPAIDLTALLHEHEWKGQALVQKVWNNLQTYPSSASDDICTTVQTILHSEVKSQDPTWEDFACEMAEVVERLEKMIYESLVQELSDELTTLKSK